MANLGERELFKGTESTMLALKYSSVCLQRGARGSALKGLEGV